MCIRDRAWISDTQLYSESYPAVFDSMTGWLADNAEKEGIRYLLHTGDVVNNRNSDGQWDNAVAAMNRLEGRLPYLISAGNHDVGAPTGNSDRFTTRFGRKEPEGGGLWEGGKGQYALLDAGGDVYKRQDKGKRCAPAAGWPPYRRSAGA